MQSDQSFKEEIYKLVAQIPKGQLMTYGQIAALCGRPRAAWEVGQIAHFGPTDLPWHRVVNKQGGLAKGWPGGVDIQRQLLADEGVVANELLQVDVAKLQWWPND